MQIQHGIVAFWKFVDIDFLWREIQKYLECKSKSIEVCMLKNYNYMIKIGYTCHMKRYYKYF